MLCHLDDRNFEKIQPLAEIFSEFNLVKFRILVEVEYILALSKARVIKKKFTPAETNCLRTLFSKFDDKNFRKLKLIEKKTNHDIKAIEYWLGQKITQKGIKGVSEFIHFGLTSEDINNLAYGLLILQAKHQIIIPRLEKILSELIKLAHFSINFVMLSRTHGQPASPTTFGKEVAIFANRLKSEIRILRLSDIEGKLNGTIGNYNALHLCYPKIDWLRFSEEFINSLMEKARPLMKAGLSLKPNLITSQILPYDSWIRHFDCLKRINNILLGLTQDFWWYASLGYLKLRVISSEVGSSAMPHKVNPIDLEAAEGNLGFSNSMLAYFGDKLSRTRLQHDLSDSTVRRNIGLALGYSYFAHDSILRALSRLTPNREAMLIDLNQHWEVLAEGYVALLKTNGQTEAYEQFKKLTRGKILTKENFRHLLGTLPPSPRLRRASKLPKAIKEKLESLTPEKYFGLAGKLAKI